MSRFLRSVATDTGLKAITWDEAGSSLEDVEVLLKARGEKLGSGTGANQIGAVLRLTGSAASPVGYLIGFGSSNNIVIRRQAASSTDLDSGGTGFADDTWVWVRARVEGTSLKGKAWADGDTEPAGWDVEVTDSGISGAGAVGFYPSWGTGTIGIYPVSDCDYFEFSAL